MPSEAISHHLSKHAVDGEVDDSGISKHLRISLLLDAYAPLLTERQRQGLQLHYEADLSFGEIAKEIGISRQAAFDAVRHGEETLERFESILGLASRGWAAWTSADISAWSILKSLEELRQTQRQKEFMPKLDALIHTLTLPLTTDSE